MDKRLDTATRARRLVALLPHLHKGDRIPLSELASAVGCTQEEVAADLTTLTMCGIPPFTPFDMVDLDIDEDAVTVYMDPPGLDQPLRLTMAEARALGAALELAGYSRDNPLRVKLAAVTSEAVSQEEMERTVRTNTAPGGAAEVYAILAAAADAHEKVEITYYTGSTGSISKRTVHPWTIVQRLGTWYLVALCEEAGQERVFRMDRIRAISRSGEYFAWPSEVSGSVTPDSAQLRVAEIRFAPDSRVPDERSWPGVQFEPQDDGGAIARVPYQTASWMARRVVSYLGSATVLAPEEVRWAVRELAEDTLSQVM